MIGYILEPGEEVPEEWPVAEPIKGVTASTSAVTPAKTAATPAARRLVRDKGMDLGQIEGTGEGGFITSEEVLRFEGEPMRKMVTLRPGRIKASPRARRLAEEKGISLEQIEGSGQGGRVSEQDILDFLASQELVTPSLIQRVTAKRVSESFASVPHFYLGVEAVAPRLFEWRERLIPAIEEKVGVRVTFTDLLIILVAEAHK